MFVDVRGFTSLAERLPPTEVAARLNRFYDLAAKTVFSLDGTLDKMIGDQVMAFFGAPFRKEGHPQRGVRAALEIVSGMHEMAEGEDALEVGAGVGTGMALVGNVAEGEIADFTVIGDVVNTTARLQGAAAAGEVLVTEETYAWVVDQFPDAPAKDLTLKGKAEPVAARVLLAAGASGPTVRNRHPDVGRS